MSYIYVFITIVLTVYGQLALKWQVSRAGAIPGSLARKADFFAGLLVNPWVVSAFVAAFFAALSWIAALSHLELSRAYPFMGLTFILALVFSSVFFGEALTVGKLVGVGLIVAGIGVVGARW